MKSEAIEIAQKYLGAPFRPHEHPHAVSSPAKGFDCAGFVRFVLQEAGYQIPDALIHARDLFDEFGVPITQAEARAGDLVFFSKLGIMPSHVAIYAGDGRVIHASRLIGRVGYSGFEDLYFKFPREIVAPTISPKKFYSNPIAWKTFQP